MMRAFWRSLAPALALLLALALPLPGGSVAQDSREAQDLQDDQPQVMVPRTGLKATMQGSRVVLNPDGTWDHANQTAHDRAIGITDTGQTVELSVTRSADGPAQRTWQYLGTGAGPLQVAVTRAVTTDQSIHSKRDNCIPVVTVRNLTRLSLHRMIIEIAFTDTGGQRGGTSLMVGPMDDGEEREVVSAPLFVAECDGLTGVLRVPFCAFQDGAPCNNVVSASAWGVIPLALAADAGETADPPGATAK